MWWLHWLDPLSCECHILGCHEQTLCRPPGLGFEGHTSGPYLLPCLVVEWAGLQVMFWRLVRFSTGALSCGLYANPLEMAIQSAVACSEAKDEQVKTGALLSDMRQCWPCLALGWVTTLVAAALSTVWSLLIRGATSPPPSNNTINNGPGPRVWAHTHTLHHNVNLMLMPWTGECKLL